MRCQACEAENGEQQKECQQCGARLARPSRRREIQNVHNAWASDRLDDRAFRIAIWGLIPPLGLILGPWSLVQGIVSVRRARAAGEMGRTTAMTAAIAIGGAETLCCYLGVSLMLMGLMS
jgi:hypothetical protein